MSVPHAEIADDIMALQPEKESETRPAPEEYNRDDEPFPGRIHQVIGSTRQQLLPMARYQAFGGTGQ